MPYYVVNEFPKSGGTWLAQMLADALELPFRRNKPIRLEKCVTHGHFLNPTGIRNVVVLWRDPRDVIVSLYHHSYFVNEHSNRLLVQLMKERLPFDDYRDVRNNLPEFIQFISTNPITPRFTWSQFVDVWLERPGTVQTSYEELRQDAAGTLWRIVMELTGRELPKDRCVTIAENHSFERAKERAAVLSTKPGVEMSFVRDGSVGGWRNYFSDEAIEEMNNCYPRIRELVDIK